MVHSLLRTVFKWGSAGVTALLGGVLLFTCLFPGHWRSGGSTFRAIEPGYLCLEEIIAGPAPTPVYGLHRRFTHPFGRAMWFTFYDGPRGSWITAPVLGPALLAGLATGVAWRFDALARRRTLMDCCAACGYDREGLEAGAVCPECGNAPGTVRPARDTGA